MAASEPRQEIPSPATAFVPAQESPPDIDELGFLAPLTPAEMELVLATAALMDRELKARPDDFEQIRQKYRTLVRNAPPPGKYLIARVMLGGC